MKKNIIITDRKSALAKLIADYDILTPQEYFSNDLDILNKAKKLQFINLCRSYDYLSAGYYCSLFAEARRQKMLPDVNTLLELNWKRIHSLFLDELDEILQSLNGKIEPDKNHHIRIYFGQTREPIFAALAKEIFAYIHCPMLDVVLSRPSNKNPKIKSIEPLSIDKIPIEEKGFFVESLQAYTGAKRQRQKSPQTYKYHLAILCSPEDEYGASNPKAIKNFIKAGEKLGVYVEVLTSQDISRLNEFDALFIRDNTVVNNHTFRFAKKAAFEGLVVIDDPLSIIRCGNKVYLEEYLRKANLPRPRSMIIDKSFLKSFDSSTFPFDFPVVLKVPDSSFSLGVKKADNAPEFKKMAEAMLGNSELVIIQEFMKTSYDWRVGVLNGEILYVCKYFMADDHWQIYNHDSQGDEKYGYVKTLAIHETPKDVLTLSLKATKIIGDGLYGVDIKEGPNGDFKIVEVNDNPNIDAGFEDEISGMALYEKIIQDFIRRIDAIGS